MKDMRKELMKRVSGQEEGREEEGQRNEGKETRMVRVRVTGKFDWK